MKLIITADWHLRASRPRCRTDSDWIQYQKDRMGVVRNIAKVHKAKIAFVGDLFDTARPGQRILNAFLSFALDTPDGFYGIPGNHDLLYHSWEDVNSTAYGSVWALMQKKSSGLYPLWELGRAAPFGQPPQGPENAKLLFIHTLTFPSEEAVPFGVTNYTTAQELLRENPEAQWIFTGDYHQAFAVRSRDGRWCVNPGCLTIQEAGLADYRPSVYLVDTDRPDIAPEKIFLPDESQYVSRWHLDRQSAAEARISAFIERVGQVGNMGLDFESNVRNARMKVADKRTLFWIDKLMEEVPNDDR